MNPEEFKKVARAVSLSLDSSESVKKQGNVLVAARKKLKQYHQQIVVIEQSKQQPPFSVAELEDDPKLFKRLMAIQQRSNEILNDAKWLRLIIESLAIDCNKLIVKAKKYLQDPEGVQQKQQPSQPTISQTRSQPSTPPQPTKPTTAAPKTRTRSNQPKTTSLKSSRTNPQTPEGLDFVGKIAFWLFPPSQGKYKWWIVLLALSFWYIAIPWLIWTRTGWSKWAKGGVIGGVLLLAIIALVTSDIPTTSSSSSSPSSSSDPEYPLPAGVDRPSSLEFHCREEVKKQLKNPRGAEFPGYQGIEPNYLIKERKWVFVSYVDATNTFGAMIRTNYKCVVSVDNGEIVITFAE